MKCVIIANGNICNYSYAKKIIDEHDLIICADGGARHLLNMERFPHVIVGDLDSIGEKARNYFEKNNVTFYKFPVKKDYTDTELAIEYALNHHVDEITFLGTMGSRMDHTLANITLLLPLTERGIKAKMIDDHNEIRVVTKYLEVQGDIGGYISIIPISEKVTGVTLRGLEYPLEDATMYMGSSLGVSNRFTHSKASISIGSGKVVLIKARD